VHGIDVTTEASIAPIAAAWDHVAVRAGAPPFVRPGWFSAWWDAFGGGEPAVLAAWRGGDLAGVLPLRRRGGVLTSPTNAHTPVFGLAVADREAAAALARAPFALGARRVQIDYVDAEDRALAAVCREAAATGHRVLRSTVQRSPYLVLDGGPGDVEGRLSAKLRSNFRRLTRRLEERGRLELDIRDGHRDLDALVAEGLPLEASGWKDERGTAILSSAATRRFYTGVARWAAGAGLLRLAFLRLDGRALAFYFCLQDAHAFYLVKGGYDPAEHRFAPGKMLVRALVHKAAAEGLERFEFLGADEPWKLEWGSRTHERLLVRAFAATPRATAERAAQTAYLRYGRPLARRALDRLR
jgi:CelD/BcsL family acetyltransferase involved in cellulose biosynthesis